MTWVNQLHYGYDELPFGGTKHSGFGKEHGIEVLDFYTEEKSVVMGGVFPAGTLRETFDALVRASAVVLTRTQPGRSYPGLQRLVRAERHSLARWRSEGAQRRACRSRQGRGRDLRGAVRLRRP